MELMKSLASRKSALTKLNGFWWDSPVNSVQQQNIFGLSCSFFNLESWCNTKKNHYATNMQKKQTDLRSFSLTSNYIWSTSNGQYSQDPYYETRFFPGSHTENRNRCTVFCKTYLTERRAVDTHSKVICHLSCTRNNWRGL